MSKFKDYERQKLEELEAERTRLEAEARERGEKYCPRCEDIKPTDWFYRDSGRPDGLTGWCKECMKEEERGRYKLEREIEEEESVADCLDEISDKRFAERLSEGFEILRSSGDFDA